MVPLPRSKYNIENAYCQQKKLWFFYAFILVIPYHLKQIFPERFFLYLFPIFFLLLPLPFITIIYPISLPALKKLMRIAEHPDLLDAIIIENTFK